MRLRLSINDVVRCTAAVIPPGYLNAHINLTDRPEKTEAGSVARVTGNHLGATETTSFRWPEIEVKIGDRVGIEILAGGESDSPTETRKSSESPSNLCSDASLAKELTELVSAFDKQLMAFLEEAKKREPAKEYKKITDAVGAVVYETGERLLYPVFRRHKDLIPSNLKGDLL